MMRLTTGQIESLLQQGRDAGLDADELEALEWYLLDRAAELDGATRLDAALAMMPPKEVVAAAAFMDDSERLRKTAMERGADILNNISDEEWENLIS